MKKIKTKNKIHKYCLPLIALEMILDLITQSCETTQQAIITPKHTWQLKDRGREKTEVEGGIEKD